MASRGRRSKREEADDRPVDAQPPAPSRGAEQDAAPRAPGGAKDPRLGRRHDRILDALGEIEAGTPADKALRGVFSRARDLGARERTEVSEIVYGLIRAQRSVDDALARAMTAERRKVATLEAPIRARLRVLAYLALRDHDVESLRARDPYLLKRVPGVLERIATGRLPAGRHSPLEALGLELALPDWIVERLVTRFGTDEARRIGRALDGRAAVALRVNTMVQPREAARERIRREHGVETEPTARSPLGLLLAEPADVLAWPIYQEGGIELQDEASQLVTLATGTGARETVLDACAGAGGKTLALAAMTENSGRVVAVDPDARRLEELKRRARRAKLTNVDTLVMELEALPEKYSGTFDRVLVDAPCTGSGTFRRHPDARWRVTERDLELYVARQKRILARAIGAAKPGGFIVYATCSVLAEENEEVVEELVKLDGRVEPAPFSDATGAERARHLSPHLGAWSVRIGPGPTERDPDGFYIALLRRRS